MNQTIENRSTNLMRFVLEPVDKISETNSENSHQKERDHDLDEQNSLTKSYFEKELPAEAMFQLSEQDWSKLKSLQHGHRFLKGEWEDYFILGMKQSNKYCVFAFKDHYVNQACMRARKAKMESSSSQASNSSNDSNDTFKNIKVFSAQGYCVFQDCPVKFSLKMNNERLVYVNYVGQIRHSVNEVRARFFRGKSRQELREVLKTSSPLNEFKNRQKSIEINNQNNFDYVGRTKSVYKRISAEAKDSLHSLLLLRKQFIQMSLQNLKMLASNIGYDSEMPERTHTKGYIQLIQQIPGTIVCYDHLSLCFYHKLFVNPFKNGQSFDSDSVHSSIPCLYINSAKHFAPTSTTLNSNNLHLYEMCLRKPTITVRNQAIERHLIPLSLMFSTDPASCTSLSLWLNMFFSSERNVFYNYYSNVSNKVNTAIKYVVCDNSMPLIRTLVQIFCQQTFSAYAKDCFSYASNCQSRNDVDSFVFDLNLDALNADVLGSFPNKNSPSLVIHTCTYRLMKEIEKMCFYYSRDRQSFCFNMSSLSVIANSQSLNELQQSIYAFMCILYSKTTNRSARKAFEYLREKISHYETLECENKNEEFSVFNPAQTQELECCNKSEELNKIEENCSPTENNLGLIYLRRENYFDPESKTCAHSDLNKSNRLKFQEDQLKHLNASSLFYKMCEKLFEKCKTNVDLCEKNESIDSEENVRPNTQLNHKLLFFFVEQFSATIPLWTKLIVPHDSHLPTTLDLHEQRFRRLFNINAKNSESVDSLIRRLYDENQKIVEENLKTHCLSENELTSSHSNWPDTQNENSELLNLKQSFQNSDLNSSTKTELKNVNQTSYLMINKHNISDLEKASNSTPSKKVKKYSKQELFELNKRHEIGTAKLNNSSQDAQPPHKEFNIVCLRESNIIELKNQDHSRTRKPKKKIPIVENDKEIIIERQHHILSNKFGFELVKEDLESLELPNKPNTNIIEFYLKLLEEKVNSNCMHKHEAFICPVSFYLTLKYGQNANSLCNLEHQNFCIFNYNLVIVPIHKVDHWALACVDFRKQRITYYDCLLVNDFDCLKYLTDYINKQHMKQNQAEFKFQNWKISNEKSIPKQLDSRDSGVFVLFYAKCLMFSQDPFAKIKEIESFRQEVKNQIFENVFK